MATPRRKKDWWLKFTPGDLLLINWSDATPTSMMYLGVIHGVPFLIDICTMETNTIGGDDQILGHAKCSGQTKCTLLTLALELGVNPPTVKVGCTVTLQKMIGKYRKANGGEVQVMSVTGNEYVVSTPMGYTTITDKNVARIYGSWPRLEAD
jgi:hypothetical protein